MPAVNGGAVLAVRGRSTESTAKCLGYMEHDLASIADGGLVERAVAAARAAKPPMRVGNVFSADLFYTPQPEMFDVLEKLGVLGVEMEAAGLYGVAAQERVAALTILTVSDHIRREESLSSEDRRTSFDAMIRIALDAAVI